MSSQKPRDKKIEQPNPDLIPPPDPVNANASPGYNPARDEIQTAEDVSLVENFIGSIYGEAKRLDGSNMSPENQFTKGLKMDAAAEIKNVRQTINRSQGHYQPQPPPPSHVQQHPQSVSHPLPVTSQINQVPVVNAPGDSLILKHEIDQLKEQIKDIKKLYDEFFKLKQVKGKWVIQTDSKTQNATTIAKTWNIINKLLKNKTKQIIIQYTEDEPT